MFPFLLLLPLLLALASVTHAQIGTTTLNISSDSTQLTYLSTWRSDTSSPSGLYEAYSNASDASLVFAFKGVKVAYVAQKKYDRGLFLLRVDGATAYTVDLYDDSGFEQPFAVEWTSPVMEYGMHNVTMEQIGIDARFGYYPYLFTSTWIETVPTSPSSYTATESVSPSASTSPTIPPSHASHVAPIVGGAVGGVVAVGLLAFLVFLWRKDAASRQRGGGGMIQKVRKSDGGMVIEEDSGLGLGGAGLGGGVAYGWLGSHGGTSPTSSGPYDAPPPVGSPPGTGRASWSYPYHVQGTGDARYPVPEI